MAKKIQDENSQRKPLVREVVSVIKDAKSMEELLAGRQEKRALELGAITEGTVVTIAKNKVLVDLNGLATGIIAGKELRDSGDTFANLKIGDKVKAAVIDTEGKDGHIILSLHKAAQYQTWEMLEEALNSEKTLSVTVQEANKGGLLLEMDGIKGFIPVSQLSPEYYPRVNKANSEEILKRLQKLIGQQFNVKVLSVDKQSGKMILSEKKAHEEQFKKSFDKLKVGQVIKGRVSGVVDFGIFVTFEGVEGLVHISEITWDKVENPADHAKVGDDVEAMIIGIENGKISLSMKRLLPDPWVKAAERYKVGDVSKGLVTKISNFGVFVRLDDDINGLIHISEISHQKVEDPTKFVKIGEEVEIKVIAVEVEEHRIGLSLKAMQPIDEEKKEDEKDVKEKKEKKGKKESKKVENIAEADGEGNKEAEIIENTEETESAVEEDKE